jgi:hypothetical protein
MVAGAQSLTSRKNGLSANHCATPKKHPARIAAMKMNPIPRDTNGTAANPNAAPATAFATSHMKEAAIALRHATAGTIAYEAPDDGRAGRRERLKQRVSDLAQTFMIQAAPKLRGTANVHEHPEISGRSGPAR